MARKFQACSKGRSHDAISANFKRHTLFVRFVGVFEE